MSEKTKKSRNKKKQEQKSNKNSELPNDLISNSTPSGIGASQQLEVYLANFHYSKMSDRERDERESLLKRTDLLQQYQTPERDRMNSEIKFTNENPLHIPPMYFLHLIDTNTNVSRVECGPKTLTIPANEMRCYGPVKMLQIPPQFYCVIENPVIRNPNGSIKLDPFGQASLQHGQIEVRIDSEPFPLYPGEQLITPIKHLPVVMPDTALVLRAKCEFVDEFTDLKKIDRIAGEEWLFEGPRTYIPSPYVDIISVSKASVIKQNQALKLEALVEFTDRNGIERHAGELWLMRKPGSYLQTTKERIIEVVDGIVLTSSNAIHLRALHTYVDIFGRQHKAGELWMVTNKECDVYLPDVHEEVLKTILITTLDKMQYCVVNNPVDQFGNSQLGQKKLITGETSFFLHPLESIEGGVKDAILLGAEDALLLRANEFFVDERNVPRNPGSSWLIYGPTFYIPALQVQILEQRKAILQLEPLGLYFFFWKKSRKSR